MKQWQIFLMAGLFLAVFSSFENAEAPASPVTIASDITSADILVDELIVATLTIENSDTRYRTMDAYLIASWPTGVKWSTYFLDTNYDEIEDSKINISKGSSVTVKLAVACEGVCSAGDNNTFLVFAKTDPKFYNYDGNVTDTCGSDDCRNDTTPASASVNVTNSITISLTARTAYRSDIACDAASSEGSNEVSQGNTTLWGYTLTNTGWNTDTYQFTSTMTSADGHDVRYWTLSPGMADGRELTGQSDTSSSAVHTAEGSISIIPATNATSGIYNVELTVTSNNGAPDSVCDFDVVVPGSETEEETAADPANETAEKETEEIEEVPREVPSVSLIPALLSIGLIAVFRRK